jgi:hypothetical protein
MSESNPQKANPDQLEFISPRNVPGNPARYEAPAVAEELTKVPTVTLGPNAVYLVQPGYWDEKLGEKPVEPPVVEEEKVPSLTSVEPSNLPVWAMDTEVFWHGENFTENSKIIWNDGEEPTNFVSATRLSTIVKPSTVQVAPPYTIQTYVRDGANETVRKDFTFIA